MFQKVILVGAVAKDVASFEKNGKKFCRLTVTTWHSKYNEETSRWERDMTFHNVTVFGKAAESAAKLEKGDSVMVEGEIRMNTWTTKEGIQYKSAEIIGTVKKNPLPPLAKHNYEEPAPVTPNWTPDAPSKAGEQGYNDDLPF